MSVSEILVILLAHATTSLSSFSETETHYLDPKSRNPLFQTYTTKVISFLRLARVLNYFKTELMSCPGHWLTSKTFLNDVLTESNIFSMTLQISDFAGFISLHLVLCSSLSLRLYGPLENNLLNDLLSLLA